MLLRWQIFGCSAVLDLVEVVDGALADDRHGHSSLAFCTRPEKLAQHWRGPDSNAVLASSVCFGSLSSALPAAVNSLETLDSSSVACADQLGVTAQRLAWVPSTAMRLAAVEGLHVLALRGDGGLEIKRRRLAVHEQLAEIGGGLVEVAIELREIREP